MTKTVLVTGRIIKRNGKVVSSNVTGAGYVGIVASSIPWGKNA